MYRGNTTQISRFHYLPALLFWWCYLFLYLLQKQPLMMDSFPLVLSKLFIIFWKYNATTTTNRASSIWERLSYTSKGIVITIWQGFTQTTLDAFGWNVGGCNCIFHYKWGVVSYNCIWWIFCTWNDNYQSTDVKSDVKEHNLYFLMPHQNHGKI